MVFTNVSVPSVHGGHSVIDNHHPKHCGLSSEKFWRGEWLFKECAQCEARRWCYNIQKPEPYEMVDLLEIIYLCYLKIAKKQKIQPYGLTIHLPFPFEFIDYLRQRYDSSVLRDFLTMPVKDLGIFIAVAERLRKKVGPEEVVFCVEVDLLPRRSKSSNRDFLDDLVKSIPEIIIIGSVHFVEIDGEILRVSRQDAERAEKFIRQRGIRNFWKEVIRHNLQLLEEYPIDVLGHLFVFQKHLEMCPEDDKEINALVDKIIKQVVDREIFIDINSSGLVKGRHNDNPYFPPHWLKRFNEAGAHFVLGDDAHSQHQIGQKFDEVRDYLIRNGVNVWSLLVETKPCRHIKSRPIHINLKGNLRGV